MILAALFLAIITGGLATLGAAVMFNATFWSCLGIYVLVGSLTTLSVACLAVLLQPRHDADAESGEIELAHV
ncbi:hypothetical protein [Tritonibacter sp. SIMBA_163]|uniref:hypothetical protein n=1 Tax=Tritonibacter TaxID=2083206 RepID=UPI0039811C95